MKIKARINILKYMEGLTPGQVITVNVDEDYVSDFDDIIQEIENELWTLYGQSLYFNVDFTVVNEKELCDELLNRQNEGLEI